MRQHNAENERVKRDYLIYLKAAKGLSEASLDTVRRFIVSRSRPRADVSRSLTKRPRFVPRLNVRAEGASGAHRCTRSAPE